MSNFTFLDDPRAGNYFERIFFSFLLEIIIKTNRLLKVTRKTHCCSETPHSSMCCWRRNPVIEIFKSMLVDSFFSGVLGTCAITLCVVIAERKTKQNPIEPKKHFCGEDVDKPLTCGENFLLSDPRETLLFLPLAHICIETELRSFWIKIHENQSRRIVIIDSTSPSSIVSPLVVLTLSLSRFYDSLIFIWNENEWELRPQQQSSRRVARTLYTQPQTMQTKI